MKTYSKYRRIKKKKSILKNRFFWLTLLFFIFVGGIFYLVCFADFFQIKKIEIAGQQKISEEELKYLVASQIEQKLFFFSTKSIFLIKTNKISQMILEKFPQITEANLKRKLPDRLFLEIKEREPWAAIIVNETDFYYCDENGIVFEKIWEIPPKFLIINNLVLQHEIKLGEKVIEKDLIEKINRVNTKLKDNLKIDIEGFIIPSPERLNVKTFEGWEIYFDPVADLNWQAIELGLVLEKQIPPEKRGNLEYIDLRFSKVYFKYR
jgi:cell division septal protein FtsQ